MKPGTIERIRIIRERISLIRQQSSILRIKQQDFQIEIQDLEKVISYIKIEDKGEIPGWQLYPAEETINIKVN